MRVWLALVLALIAGPALAWTHGGGGSGPPTQTVSFGQNTLAGFGAPTLNVLSGPLTINSETNGGGASTDFCVTTDFDGTTGEIVPSGSTDNNLVCPTTGGAMTHYGVAAHSFSGPYTLSVSDTHGHTSTITINMVAHATTVKSHYAYLHNPDSGSGLGNFQLGKVMDSTSASVIALGDTVIMRNGSGETGMQPALNPLGCQGAGGSGLACNGYSLQPPAAGYATGAGSFTCLTGINAGAPCIEITSETQGVYTGQDGFAAGGGAQVGELFLNGGSQSGPFNFPVAFHYISLVRSHLYTQGEIPFPYMIDTSSGTDGSDLYGWECDYCEFFQNIPYALSAIWFSQGVNVRGSTIDHAVFHGPFMVASTVNLVHAGGANFVCPVPATYCATAPPQSAVTNSDYGGLGNDVMDIAANASNILFYDNFSSNMAGQTLNPVAGDYFIVANGGVAQVYNFVSGAPSKQGDVPISNSPYTTMARTGCAVNAGGTVVLLASGVTSAASPYSCVSGTDYWSGETADANVTAAINDVPPNTFLTLTAKSTGTGGNSIQIGAGNSTYGTCSNVFVESFTNCHTTGTVGGSGSSTSSGVACLSGIAGSGAGTSVLCGGAVGVAAAAHVIYADAHQDTVQWDNTLSLATTGGGSISGGVFTDAGTPASTGWGIGQYLFGPSITTTTQITGISAIAIAATGSSYNNGTGLVTLNLNSSTPLAPGNAFTVNSLTGTGSHLASMENKTFLAGAGTTGTTLTYTVAAGLGATTITGGNAGPYTVTGQTTLASSTVSGTPAPIRPGGLDKWNVNIRNIAGPNSNGSQRMFGQQGICCVTGFVMDGDISNLSDSNSAYMQEFNAPTIQYSTFLNDAEASVWAPCIGIIPGVYDPTQSCAANGLSIEPTYNFISAPPWSTTVSSARVIPIAPLGGGGATYLYTLSNFFDGQLTGQTVSQPAPWNLPSGTLTLTPNTNEGVGTGPALGIWAFPQFPGAEPPDGTTVYASYHLMFPHLQSGYPETWTGVPGCVNGTGVCNYAAGIWAWTPAVGDTFTGTIAANAFCMTVVSGVSPPVGTPINGAGIIAGSVVISTSAGTCSAGQLTFNIKATTGATGQLFGTLTMNPGASNGAQGTYNGALTPADSNGKACRNAGTVWQTGVTCAAQGLTVAQFGTPFAVNGQLDFSVSGNPLIVPIQ